MPIDYLAAKVSSFLHHYFSMAVEAPTHFTRLHWLMLSGVACLFGLLCLRGFGSRKNY